MMAELNIRKDFIPMGRRNRPARANPMNFITIHETGNTRAGANARAHGNFLSGNDAANAPVSWHYTTDDTETVQHLPENEDAFHAGDGAGNGNRQSIGIEICVNSDGNFQQAIERTAELTADICMRRNIPIENIRQHFDWSRKNCPQNIRAGRPLNWGAFIDMVWKHLQVRPALNSQTETGVNLSIGGVTVRVPARMEGGRWIISLPEGPEGQPQPDVLLRVALEAMGFSVSWDGVANTIIATTAIIGEKL